MKSDHLIAGKQSRILVFFCRFFMCLRMCAYFQIHICSCIYNMHMSLYVNIYILIHIQCWKFSGMALTCRMVSDELCLVLWIVEANIWGSLWSLIDKFLNFWNTFILEGWEHSSRLLTVHYVKLDCLWLRKDEAGPALLTWHVCLLFLHCHTSRGAWGQMLIECELTPELQLNQIPV